VPTSLRDMLKPTSTAALAGTPLIDQVRATRAALHRAMGDALDIAVSENRGLHASERREHDAGRVRIAELDARIHELQEQATRMAAAAPVMALQRPNGGTWSAGPLDGGVYRANAGPGEVSFFRDLVGARITGDPAAWERLRRNEAEQGLEHRALGNTNATAGSGGDFAPPGYLLEQFVRLARPGRVTADLFTKQDLPSGVSSIVIPKVLTGTAVAIQSTQNTALASTDLTTSSLSSAIVTVGGKQVVSQQLLDQSGINFDEVILGDLSAAYAQQVDQLALSSPGGTGQVLGLLNVPAVPTVVYTDAAPALAGTGKLYSKLAQAVQTITTTRFLPPSVIVMHPRRWAWMLAQFDGQNRPLILPSDGAYNPVGVLEGVAAQSYAGSIMNLPVVLDANIPTNLGAGTNQDVILVLRAEDLYLWEMVPPRMEAITQTFADSLGVLYRCYSYLSAQPLRYLSSICLIQGSGLVSPSY